MNVMTPSQTPLQVVIRYAGGPLPPQSLEIHTYRSVILQRDARRFSPGFVGWRIAEQNIVFQTQGQMYARRIALVRQKIGSRIKALVFLPRRIQLQDVVSDYHRLFEARTGSFLPACVCNISNGEHVGEGVVRKL